MDQCQGVTKSGKPCKKPATEAGYCKVHQDQAPSELQPELTSTALMPHPSAAKRLLVDEGRKSRPRFTGADGDRLHRLSERITAFRQLDKPFRPAKIQAQGINVVYDDPMLLGEKIKLSVVRHLQLKADSDASYPVLSSRLLRQMEEDLGALWCVNRNCEACGAELDPRLRGKLYALLEGKCRLPRSSGKVPEINFPNYHYECRLLLAKMAELEEELQGYAGDDPELIRLRQERYNDVILGVLQEARGRNRSLKKREVVLRMIAIQSRIRKGVH